MFNANGVDDGAATGLSVGKGEGVGFVDVPNI